MKQLSGTNTTVGKRGAHSVNMKTTGHEKSKITVCLAATDDGRKKKPFIVFKGAKREVKKLNEEFKSRYIVATSVSGWVNDELTQQFCPEVVGKFTFGVHRLLAWDAFRCHLTPEIRAILSSSHVDTIIVPGGCTKFIQAADVNCNKPTKKNLGEMYEKWLAESKHELTAQGNMRAPSRRQMVTWVLEAWKKLPDDLIRKSFKVCALSSSLDGSEDNELMCIKHGPYEELLSRLQSIEEEDIDPFDVITEDDIAHMDVADLEIDSNEEGDDTRRID